MYGGTQHNASPAIPDPTGKNVVMNDKLIKIIRVLMLFLVFKLQWWIKKKKKMMADNNHSSWSSMYVCFLERKWTDHTPHTQANMYHSRAQPLYPTPINAFEFC